MLRPFITALAALSLAGCTADAQVQGPGRESAIELTGRVVDAAELFSPGYEAKLTEKLAALEEKTLVQLVVATTPDLKGQDINDYSITLARAWGLGDAERHDGLLLLVAPNERRVRIEVGRGLEDNVKDEEAALIIQNDILPAFRAGDFETGVGAGVDALIREVSPIELKEAA